jgi:RNA polymerase sigma factor (TIGR02999 family)
VLYHTRAGVHSVIMSEVTRLIEAAAGGDRRAAAELLPLVYDELRVLAAARLAAEAPGHTLQPTALVHEAYLRLVGPADANRWDHRGHFFAAAAEAMRRVLVDHARHRNREKRGGNLGRAELPDVPARDPDERLLALDDALTRLAAEDPVAARVVELRHFAGLGHEGIAAALGLTVYAARQKWTYARAWLRDAMTG